MAESIGVLPKKRGRPATGKDPLLNFRAPETLTAAVDAYVAAQPDPKPSRSEVIRYGLTEWLITLGYLKPAPDDPEKAN